jgi:hypothetical protein
MAEEFSLIGPNDVAFHLELTAAQLKVTHTALKTLFDGLGHEERDVQAIEHEVRAIDLQREIVRRRAAAA